jgi:hypothetical protein
MRRRSVVAIAALIAAFALAGVPAPAGSRVPSTAVAPASAAFSDVTIPATTLAPAAAGPDAATQRASSAPEAPDPILDPARPAVGDAAIPSTRPRVDQPPSPAGGDWKQPRQILRGQATYYDHGTTAMRLPRGTVVVICGAGGCLERVVSDYGPQKKSRVVDLYTPDFFTVCGCARWEGVTDVTVYVY